MIMFGISRKKQPFWDWLGANASRIQQGVKSSNAAVQQEVVSRFGDAFPGLVFEISCPPVSGWMFCVSADGNPDLFPKVIEAVRSAPNVTGWEIQAFRPRGPTKNAKLNMNGQTLSYDDLWCRVVEVDSKVDVTLCIKNLNLENAKAVLGGALVLLDNAIGEFDSVTMIRELSNEPLIASPVETLDFFPMERLPAYLDRVKKMN
jgi:hypothetical protein